MNEIPGVVFNANIILGASDLTILLLLRITQNTILHRIYVRIKRNTIYIAFNLSS